MVELTLVLKHILVHQNHIDMPDMIITLFAVFATVTAYFMNQHKLAGLQDNLESCELERDNIIRGIPQDAT